MSHIQVHCAAQQAPLFPREQNIQAFIWTLTRHDNKLHFITETEPRHLWKIQPSEPFCFCQRALDTR